MNADFTTIDSTGVAQTIGDIVVNCAVIIRASTENSNNIYIGGSDVTISGGYELSSGDVLVMDTVGDLGNIYVVGYAGDHVCYITLEE